jgi:hypothetical protein
LIHHFCIYIKQLTVVILDCDVWMLHSPIQNSHKMSTVFNFRNYNVLLLLKLSFQIFKRQFLHVEKLHISCALLPISSTASLAADVACFTLGKLEDV